jgi:NAD(P)-dependent dehydrogenase (short-subunit alcohol dehydrogenase family)
MPQSKVALISGANKGLGREAARQLGAQGVTVWLGTRDEGRGRAAEAELRDEGADVRHVTLDVTQEETISAAAKRIDAEHGRLDILLNNAGIVGPAGRALPSAMPVDSLREVYETNVLGVVAVTNAMLPLLRRSPAGRIVNVSSNLGSLAVAAGPGQPAAMSQLTLLDYSSSKAALNMVTLLYARELVGTGITVNSVNPGFCATAMNDFRGVLSPAQGAAVIVRAATQPTEDGTTGAFFGGSGRESW